MCKNPEEYKAELDRRVQNYPRAKKVLDFVRAHGFDTAEAIDGRVDSHPAVEYAVTLANNAANIADATAEEAESLLVLSMLMTLLNANHATPAAMLNYELIRSGIRLIRDETVALFANPKWWKANKADNDCVFSNKLAADMYCSKLFTELASLPFGHSLPSVVVPEQLKAKYESCIAQDKESSPEEIICNLLNTFSTVYVGANHRSKIDGLVAWLQSGDFFLAPAGPDSYLDYVGGLADHTLFVIEEMMQLKSPQTEAEVGEIVLAAVCSGLYMTDSTLPYYKVRKVYKPEMSNMTSLPAGFAREPDGRVYCKETVEAFTRDNPFAIPDEAFALHKAAYLLGDALNPRVAEAIYAHQRDCDRNPHSDLILAQNDLALFLHMATIKASWHTEVS